ncbi:D-alanyl-lipoteichoic acid acyltransferase DltB, MBOAT superfamily [Fibrobacter sp. UWCM]|uniref:MBOAT family O-acyltransferase n=1 Tax=Fibrobacter sp. UWCM TaxID=1896208 RepID=UPI0009161E9B|nr:MBOAT family O-acyltransferase [Fibrobacter sp. UWCM]SHH69812.1 D-alanyl-lipoteichoic acid acyltransferase DltB, MBOAT superfamily [Fibrobacter sp. UWCM]
MSMTSINLFALLAVIFSAIYGCNHVIKDQRLSNAISKIILLIGSYIFIAYADIRFAIVLFIITFSTWFFASKTKWNFMGVLLPILALAYFKYANFFIESFAKIFSIDHKFLEIMLPIGMSFYTFSAISYVIDIRRKKITPRKFKDIALYLAFFPKIISGPIQRADDFFNQSDRYRKIGYDTFSCGIQIFVFGLFKKIVLADRLSVFVNQVYDTPAAFSSSTLLLAVFAYSLQIYLDFSGYSDMAIGIAKILGFNLPRNFNLPYLSHNVTEFWKRWHITLSSWLLDYLYISFGGNRKGKIRTYLNLIATMTIGGLWHGANYTYIVWGLLHGFALAIHKIWMTITGSPNRKAGPISTIISISLTFCFTTFCWIFFRAESIPEAFAIIHRIGSWAPGIEHTYMWFFVSAIIIIIASFYAIVKSKKGKNSPIKMNMSAVEAIYPLLNLKKFWHLVLFFMEIGLILCLAYTGGSPFIYGKY